MNPWYPDSATEQQDGSGSSVYLIEAGEHYKIGFTRNLKQRLVDINASLPHATAVAVAVRAGGRALEAQLHYALEHRRVKGEWFDKCDEVRDVFLSFTPASQEESLTIGEAA